MRIDLLWSVRGSVVLPPAAAGTVIARIAARLERLQLDHVDQGERHLIWRQGFVHFVFRRDWELLGGVDAGEIALRSDCLTYRVGFSHVLLLCLAASIFAGLFVGSGPGSTALDGVKWGLIAIFWLFGANYAVTIFQVRRFLHQVIDAAAGDDPK